MATEKNLEIVPQIVQAPIKAVSVHEISIPDSFLIYDGISFHLVTIKALDSFENRLVVPDFNAPAGQSGADSKNKVVWVIRGRGVYIADIQTNKTAHIIPTHDSDSQVKNVLLVDADSKIFLIKINQMDWSGTLSSFVLYDLNKNSIIFRSDSYNGIFFPLNSSQLMWQEYIEESNVHWHIADIEMKNIQENEFTKKLTNMQVVVSWGGKPFHADARVLFGYNEINGRNYFSAHWKKNMQDFEVEPVIFQIPKERSLYEFLSFSNDGKWAIVSSGNDDETSLIRSVFYHIDQKYPQLFSLPVLGMRDTNIPIGAFVNHTTLGPLYVGRDPEHEEILFVYKMNDVLEALASGAISL